MRRLSLAALLCTVALTAEAAPYRFSWALDFQGGEKVAFTSITSDSPRQFDFASGWRCVLEGPSSVGQDTESATVTCTGPHGDQVAITARCTAFADGTRQPHLDSMTLLNAVAVYNRITLGCG